ncbi:hydroxyacid-oxoacid transhydrogenase (plasmid) [Neorhizobium sp. NCHU2750]|nr:hydroxyacid-oxoacid transhydrogenase [Neorhizobium sp. NCHU2750]
MTTGSNWDFRLPTEIHFGWERLSTLSAVLTNLGGRHVFAMIGRSFLNRVGETGLKDLLGPVELTVFTDIEENPSINTVDTAAARCREAGADVIVAIGGGSVLDAAKCVALLQKNDGSIRDYLYQVRKPERRGLPLVAVPTTAGTGSEVTPFAVITDPEKNAKPAISYPETFPDHAIVDPALTISMPTPVAVSTGLDAMTQALEGFWSTRATEMTRAMAFRAITLIYRNLEAACLGKDRDAIEKVTLGSVIGGTQMAMIGNTALHPLSYPLTLDYNLRHGLACAIYVPAFLRYNQPAIDARFSDLLTVLGLRTIEEFAAGFEALMQRLDAPTRLSALGVERAAIPQIVKNGVGRSTAFNPRPLTEETMIEILETML